MAQDRQALIAALGFPLLVVAGGAIGWAAPDTVGQFKTWITPLLGFVMFCMGLTLSPQDFALVFKRPLPVLIGVVAQYVIMPLTAVLVVWILQLPTDIAAGVILVGCCPGGTASNVVSYLSRGDVALSVTMTSVSTILAPILTPLLTLWLAGQYMNVSGSSMSMSIVKMVLLPVVAGILVRLLLPKFVEKLNSILPWISVFAIAFIVSVVVSGSASNLATASATVLAAVVLHNCFGLLLGYGAGTIFGQSTAATRTTAIEVGMQNSGLASTLATSYLNPLAALPGAVFSVWHNVSGAAFAAWCRYRDTRTAGIDESVR